MSDLDALVPPHEPAEGALAFAGKAALSVVPVIGPLAAETLAHALESKQAQRQHDFNVAIAAALTAAIERLDGSTTFEDMVSSDEFIAAITRGHRVAAETSSEQKRRRLAEAVVNGGSWAPFAEAEREQFTRLVGDFDALHIWLLHYFTDPAGWLQARDLYQQHTNIVMAAIEDPLGSAFNVPQADWDGPVRQAAADLDRNGLASIPLTTMMSAHGIFAPRTSSKGKRFLKFINEPDSIVIDAPTVI